MGDGEEMPNGYEPRNAFEGIVITELSNIKQQIKDMPCPESFKRLNKCETDIANIKGKATVWGIVAGAISGLVSRFIPGK